LAGQSQHRPEQVGGKKKGRVAVPSEMSLQGTMHVGGGGISELGENSKRKTERRWDAF